MDLFDDILQAPPDPLFGLNTAFEAEVRKQKVNLGVGVYKTADLRPWILPSVKEAEKKLLERETSKDYLAIDGIMDYVHVTKEAVFGEAKREIYGAQTVGGTAALRIGGALLRLAGATRIYIPDPTWPNHRKVFQDSQLDVQTYPYYDHVRGGVDFEGWCHALDRMPPLSVVLMHACCHNPTGCDPTLAQWELISKKMVARSLVPFFDFAYAGFGVDLDQDASAIRLFARAGLPCLVAASHSKNFGLYAERVGALFVVCDSLAEAQRVGSQCKAIIRGLYSNPPCHGARLVVTIYQDEKLKSRWMEELASMRTRIMDMRKKLLSRLQKQTDRFDGMAHQTGMFSYTGLSREEVERLVAEYAIYLPTDGRINVAGLSGANLDTVAGALLHVIK